MIRRIICASVLGLVVLILPMDFDSEASASTPKGQSKGQSKGGQPKSTKSQAGQKNTGGAKPHMNNDLQQIFNQADANKDGLLNHDEFHAAMMLHHGGANQKAGAGKAGQANGAGGGQAKGAAAKADAPHPFKMADTNGDGQLSFQEFSAFVQAKAAQHQQKGAPAGKK